MNCSFREAHKSFVIFVTRLNCWLPGNSLWPNRVLFNFSPSVFAPAPVFCFQTLMDASPLAQTFAGVWWSALIISTLWITPVQHLFSQAAYFSSSYFCLLWRHHGANSRTSGALFLFFFLISSFLPSFLPTFLSFVMAEAQTTLSTVYMCVSTRLCVSVTFREEKICLCFHRGGNPTFHLQAFNFYPEFGDLKTSSDVFNNHPVTQDWPWSCPPHKHTPTDSESFLPDRSKCCLCKLRRAF